MVFDCFTYFNEVDIFRIRTKELNDAVDKFVVVEADQTFTGTPKPFYFDEMPDEILDPVQEKIIRVKTSFPSDLSDPWQREKYQRDQILQGIIDADEDDLIFIADVDEIPRGFLLLNKYETPTQFEVTQFFWGPYWEAPSHCNQGARPIISPKKYVQSPHDLRVKSHEFPKVLDGGWHFSFFSQDLTLEKIEAFSHTEVNLPEFKTRQHIMECLTKGIDPFGRFPLKRRRVDKTMPKVIQEEWNKSCSL